MGNSLCKAQGRGVAATQVASILTLLFCATAPLRLCAQATFSGTVVRVVAGDTLIVPNSKVLLHRVSQTVQGAIDSSRTDARGNFRFRTRPQAGANYLVSAEYDGIVFFTPPLSVDATRPDTGVRIVVADTSSGPEARIRNLSRHILVQGGDSAGWRGVMDIIIFENRSGYTRLGADTNSPSLVYLLPPGAHEPEVADGDIGPEAVRFKDGALEIYSPLAPGEASITVQYLLPAGAKVGIPVGDTVPTLNLLIDGEGALVGGPKLEGPIPTDLEGRHFRRWTGPVPGGGVLQVDLRGARTTPTWLLAVLVIAMATGLVTALVIARRRGGLAKPPVTP